MLLVYRLSYQKYLDSFSRDGETLPAERDVIVRLPCLPIMYSCTMSKREPHSPVRSFSYHTLRRIRLGIWYINSDFQRLFGMKTLAPDSLPVTLS